MKLSVDERGLLSEIDPPDTTYARDLLVSLERGDVSQMSFGFTVDEDKWEEDSDGRVIRTITKFKRLYDVSPVTYPAYPDTDVAKRSLDKFKEEREKVTEGSEELELNKAKKLKLLNLISK